MLKAISFSFLISIAGFVLEANAGSSKFKPQWACLDEKTERGEAPVIEAVFWRNYSKFPGYIDGDGKTRRAGETESFQSTVFKVDQCSFYTKIAKQAVQLVAFPDGLVVLAEIHDHWRDIKNKPVKAVELGFIETPPDWNSREGWDEIGRFSRLVEGLEQQSLRFDFEFDRETRLRGYYGIPLGWTHSCNYKVKVAGVKGLAITATASASFGRDPESGRKRCL